MTSQSGPIYEVTLFMDGNIAGECDLWLEGHVHDVLESSYVIDCHSYPIADDDEGRARRVCLYRLANDDELDRFLDGPGGNIDNELAERFEEQVTVRARVLREDAREDMSGGTPDCLNCGAYLRGQYCAVCGQRARSRLISLWELVSDAFGDLFEIDSRLWQTLIPLLIRPGRLTYDYLQGRRARFMPPFRMYLVLSLVFFVVAFFDPREDLGLLFEAEPVPDAALAPEAGADPAVEGFSFNFNNGNADAADDCNVDASDIEELPRWLQRRMTVERLQQFCERAQIDGGRAFVDRLADNIPTALIVLLPFMALVLKALYPLSRRYYVEHLLFFVHFHAFFFLVLSLQILLVRLSSLVGIPEAVPTLLVVFASLYIPVYLFMAMRYVYGQSRFVTFLKYIVLLVAYIAGFTATMMGAMLIAMFSI